MTKAFKPKIPEPKMQAQAPQQNSDDVAQQRLGVDEEGNREKRRRRGRAALRIDPQSGGSGAAVGATGVNIPMK